MDTRLDIIQLEAIARKAIANLDEDEYLDEISNAIYPKVESYIKRLVASEGVPDSGTGWEINGIELILIEKEPGNYIPSVRSEYLDAPASTWDIEIDNPVSALTIGLTDAIANELAEKFAEQE
jgi:hypothetical protein